MGGVPSRPLGMANLVFECFAFLRLVMIGVVKNESDFGVGSGVFDLTSGPDSKLVPVFVDLSTFLACLIVQVISYFRRACFP